MHEAADGGLARVRLPGGALSADQLRVLAAAAVELGDGHLELTSRANVQIRALQPGAPVELSNRLFAAGLLPSITHERVRNILASPLSGLDHHSQYDVLPVAAELDRLLCASPALAELPGRFLFALDDGRGDLAAMRADVAIRMVDGSQAELLLASTPTGVVLPADALPTVMVQTAEAFLAERTEQHSEAWRLAELDDAPRRVLARMGWALASGRISPVNEGVNEGVVLPEPTPPAAGAGAGVVGVPLGVLGAEQAEVLAGVAEAGDADAGVAERSPRLLRVTPWRSVVVPGVVVGAVVERLEAVGLVLDAGSAWNGVTSCAGRPGCGKARADVRGEARRVVPRLGAGRAVHWSGCERRCGRPGTEFIDVLALEDGGYSVDGVVGELDVEINKVRAH